MYYYSLACADAEEKKLGDTRRHLQAAFARKVNVLPGESMPDPTQDDLFLPHRRNKDLWTFLESSSRADSNCVRRVQRIVRAPQCRVW
jgi:hypothetical protein